ncbi:Uncharacterised protein [Mycobacteroides abscessus subsp. abscessus]|nr:Uncharacterised protein [Mycobacteroides abscessus subsp. abscessus]
MLGSALAQVAEHAEAVGDGDDDDVLFVDEGVRVVDLGVACPGDVRTAVDPYEYGQSWTVSGQRRVDRHRHTQPQAVFAGAQSADLIEADVGVGIDPVLGARGTWPRGVDDVDGGFVDGVGEPFGPRIADAAGADDGTVDRRTHPSAGSGDVEGCAHPRRVSARAGPGVRQTRGRRSTGRCASRRSRGRRWRRTSRR